MTIVYDNKVSGPYKSTYSGFTILYESGLDVTRYSFEFDPDFDYQQVLRPCEPNQGFFCCHITPKTAAIIQSIPTEDDELILHSLRHFVPDDLAYVSISNSMNLSHILVLPLALKKDIENMIAVFTEKVDHEIGRNLLEIDYFMPIGWYGFTDIDTSHFEIVLPDSFDAHEHPHLMGSFHPVLRSIMMNKQVPLIPNVETDYFISDEQQGAFGRAEIKVMSLMLSCDGMSLSNLINMFSERDDRMLEIIRFLVSNKYCEFDGTKYRLTGIGKIALSKAMSKLDRDFYDG